MLNTSTCLISDVIGAYTDSAAFVYGFYSFFDKIANGIAIFIVTAYFNTNPTALRLVIGLLPIVCAVFAFLLTVIGKIKYSERLTRLSCIPQTPMTSKAHLSYH